MFLFVLYVYTYIMIIRVFIAVKQYFSYDRCILKLSESIEGELNNGE